MNYFFFSDKVTKSIITILLAHDVKDEFSHYVHYNCLNKPNNLCTWCNLISDDTENRFKLKISSKVMTFIENTHTHSRVCAISVLLN